MKSKKRLKFLKEIESIFFIMNEQSTLSFECDNTGEINRCITKKKRDVLVRNGVIYFENQSNYVDNFGYQWNKFNKTQLDSYNGTRISEKRFFNATGWKTSELKNKLILDIGCGVGRFSEIALKYGAKVISVDYSDSVEAAKKNLEKFPKSLVIQCNLYELPFKEKVFDYIFCLGVLQHTPDVENAFKSLPVFLKKDGLICVDYYWKRFLTIFNSKYFFRIFTKRMKKETLWRYLEFLHKYFYPMSNFLISTPLVGKPLSRLIPI